MKWAILSSIMQTLKCALEANLLFGMDAGLSCAKEHRLIHPLEPLLRFKMAVLNLILFIFLLINLATW